MSRSYKKTPVFNNARTSNRKEDRTDNNRSRRHKEKQIIKSADFDPEGDIFPEANEISTPWEWGCDGWRWVDLDKWAEPHHKKMGK